MRKAKPKFKIGMEIESILNTKIHKFEIGDYHNGEYLTKKWTAEKDGSLRESYNVFNNDEYNYNARGCEFVSTIVSGKKEFQKLIKQFQEKLSKKGKYELNQVLVFNESCGNHIHISLDDEFRFTNKVLLDVLKKSREYFLNRVKNSKIESKDRIIKHYFRGYAKKTTNRRFYRLSERTSEFNSRCEIYDNKGLEWRSINILGVKSWAEFNEIMNIIYDSVEFLVENSIQYSKKGTIKIKGINEIQPELNENTEIEIKLYDDENEEKEIGINDIRYDKYRFENALVEKRNSEQERIAQNENQFSNYSEVDIENEE